MFAGFAALNANWIDDFLSLDGSDVPHDADSAPTVQFYGPSGAIGAPITAAKTDSTTGLYRYSATLSAANGFSSGQTYRAHITWVISTVTYGEVRSFQVT